MNRNPANRCRNWTGTVHYSNADGKPACAPVRTNAGWLSPSVATVTCARCIARFGADEPGHSDPPPPLHANEHAARRAAERAARRAERGGVKGYAARSAFRTCGAQLGSDQEEDAKAEPERCGNTAGSGNGLFVCSLPLGHKGWHEQADTLRGGGGGSYVQRTNWGDDGLAIHASRDQARRNAEQRTAGNA